MRKKYIRIAGELPVHPEEILEDINVAVEARPSGPVHVPLVIYIGDERKILGDAIIAGNQVEAFIHPGENSKTLGDLVEEGIIQSISVAFNAPPSTPVLKDGTIRWMKSY